MNKYYKKMLKKTLFSEALSQAALKNHLIVCKTLT